jgi:integrase/recombinase XerD
MKENEYEEVSEVNKKIAHKYIESIENGATQKSQQTIDYNAKIVKFTLLHIKTDLDKLTVDDIDDFKKAVNNWSRKDGKDRANTTKKQYFVGFKRFLHWYAKRYEYTKYLNLANQIEIRGMAPRKLPSDLLTTEEVENMIASADLVRDKAIITTLAESGCRMGELISCRIKDVEFTNNGCKLTFPKGKTGSRTVPLVAAASYIDHYVRQHPLRDSPEAPLWLTHRQNEHRALAYPTIHGIIRDIAKQAGIKKRVHPHLFRHTAATQLAKVWSEPQMKAFLGWEASSNMPSVYIHLSGDDVETAVLSDRYGLIEKKKNDTGLEVGKCPKCWKMIPANAIFCYNCGCPLTEGIQQSINTTTADFTAFINQNQDLVKQFMNQLQKNLSK